jgi:cell division protein FtsI (penicillin-binding protein 3)
MTADQRPETAHHAGDLKLRSVRIITVLLVLLILAFLALAWRCFHLQYFERDRYASLFLEQRRSRIPENPQRGIILDRRGRVLAASNRTQVIFADPTLVEDVNATATQLASVVGTHASIISDLIATSPNRRFVKIKEGADSNQCKAVHKIQGIGVQSQWVRHYPMGRLLANVIGFVSPSPENRGLEGIEYQYDEQLTGSSAQNVFLADVYRRPIRLASHAGRLSDGAGIILTLDATIQQLTREELLKQFEEYRAESAVAIVAEPKTGELLAMVSLPDFDPSEIGSTDPNLLRNRAVVDEFEPGSVIKPTVLALALDAGVVNTTETIFCENGSYGGHGSGFGVIHEYRGGFGDLTVREILANSSNIGMAKIGQRLGSRRLYEGLKLFGFGKPVDVELPGAPTAQGRLRQPADWTEYSVTRVPFGQEISVTALQLVRAFCILANHGRVVQPHLVKAMVNSDGQIIVLKAPPPPVGYVVKPQIADWIVRDAMTSVINDGSGKRAKLEKWQVFGKTGTGNLYDPALKTYSDNDYIASFVGGAPVEDPAIIVLVSICKPSKKLGKGYTGGVIAAPVTAKIIERTLSYIEVR